jgi:pSer/pThr/pTyr-binding forkhead associated (FHA) protein/tetratricopeptide (TPR) repeat protein
VVERLDSVPSGEDDMSPTGEHGPAVPLSSGELIPESSIAIDPSAEGIGEGSSPDELANLAIRHTMPPELRRPRAEPPDELLSSASEEEIPELEADEEMESAPTRIEHGEDILGPESGGGVPRVVIIGGNNRGKEFELKRGDNSLGRGIDNDVVLADIAVSRKHTLICFENGRFVMRDLGSGNGTLVNGERLDAHTLEDGDQLELGNTLLRFSSPPLQAGELAKLATVITPRELVDGAAPAKPQPTGKAKRVHTVERTPTAGARGPGMSPRTKKLAIFGSIGLVLFLGLMVGVKAWVNAKKRDEIARSQPKPDEILAQEFQEGITEFNAKNWEKAREHFLRVLALAPSQGHVKQYVDQASAEMVARDAVERAKARLSGIDYAGARQELSKIKSGSSYRSEAEAVGKKVDEQEVSALLTAAKRLVDSGDTPGALEKVKAAQALAPQRSDVKDLYASLTSGGTGKKPGKKVVEAPTPTPTPKVTPKVTPKATPKVAKVTPKAGTKPEPRHPPAKKEEPVVKVPPGGAAKAAIALYKKRQFGPAYDTIKGWADSQKGKKQKAARALADNIRIVGQTWQRADAAKQPANKLRYYQDALAADAKVEKGPHQKALKDLVVKSAREQATMAFTKRQYGEAYKAVKVAEKNGGARDPGLQKVVAALQKQAEDLFDKAYTIRTSNMQQARRMWQEVLRMVPTTSAVYQKAYKWLNNSSPNYQDQDED